MTTNLGYKLSFISISLFLGYVAVVLTGILPLAVLDANWQIRFCTSLVDNAPLPLVGVAILHLATHLDGANLFLRKQHAFVSKWAMVVAAGFLLLLPLQAASVLRVYSSNLKSESGGEKAVVVRKFDGLRQAINSATTTADLQQRLKEAGGPTLSPETLATPLPILRSKLLVSLEQARSSTLDQLSRSQPSMLWTLLQRYFHVFISAVGYGLGFAATAQRPDSELSILQEWVRARKIRKRRPYSPADSSHRKGILARLEEWQARQAYKRRFKSSRSSKKKVSGLDDRTYIEDIHKEDDRSR